MTWGLPRSGFLEPGILAKGVAADLGVHEVLLYRWRKEYREGKFSVDMRRKKIALDKIKMSELIHIRELEREINKLRIENELLKKTIEFNSEKRKTYSNS